MSKGKKDLTIKISWSIKTRDCYKGINIINNAFQIDKIKLFLANNINIEITSMFIPGKVLVFLWHYFYNLDTQWKNLSITFQPDLYDFINKCGLNEYINKKYISTQKLGNSVLLPFSRVSTQNEFKDYLDNFLERLKIPNKYDIVSYICNYCCYSCYC